MTSVADSDPFVRNKARDAEGLPPSNRLSAGEWAKKNLLNNWYNSLITVVVACGMAFAVVRTLGWLFSSDFLIIRRNLAVFMVGQFPRDELWRTWASGYLLMGAFGVGSGVLWRSAQADAEEKGLPTEPHSWPDLLRRFWAIIAVLVFFVSFARTAPPFVGLASAFAVFWISRESGRRFSAAARARGLFFAGLLGLLSLLVLAGSGGLVALTVGGLVGAWTLSEVRRYVDDYVVGRGAASPEVLGQPQRDQRWRLPDLFKRPAWATWASRAAAVVVGAGVWFGLRAIDWGGYGWEDWGGLHLTLFVTVIGISAGLPVGILLALGRQSDLPVIKGASVIFIEFVRGVPLISLLLFSWFMLPLLFPIDLDIPGKLTRAMIVITAFSAAYIAEIVRGGLQSVPRGQVEAAQASGMSAGRIQRLIVLPQALRAVIPAMVGQFISLFKDTSLLAIIGLLDFLRASAVANAQTEFLGQGLVTVTYPFVALGYWAFAYTMSKESRRVEERLGVGVR
ncbi:MAG: amino acid ABC transporter permease [Acidimicrobiaceae bacterium]|nr:amino acid ABC transporter permease [Acidimicrobiaceae bacterium]